MTNFAPGLSRLASRLFAGVGLRVSRIRAPTSWFPIELSEADRKVIELVKSNQWSMASKERLCATLLACRHVVEQRVKGDFVECGVWRGGNSIIAADVFQREQSNRSIYLFDTFAGMTQPTDLDVSHKGEPALEEYLSAKREGFNDWCYASSQDVLANFASAGLLESNVKLIKGDVLKTLDDSSQLPEQIAVLRLDTDWYESTRKELEVLYPRLSQGGLLIVDDYGHWGGARKAVDEYFATRPKPFLSCTDYTGRIGVKSA